jgi:hypothetical protein
MPSTWNNPSPRRAAWPRLKRLSGVALLALVCGGRAGADTVTMQDAQKAEKVRERVLERIAEGVTSGVVCVEPGLQLPLKKEVLIPTGVIVVTTVLISDPGTPEPDPPARDPAQPVPEPPALLLLAAGLGYASLRLRGRRSY